MFDIALVNKFRRELMGFAIIWVMIFHCLSDHIKALGIPVLSFLSKQGDLGVELFLFLSGIGLFYSMSKNEAVLPFYRRRINRVIIPWLIISCPYWILKSIIVDHDGAMVFLENWSGVSLWTKGVTTVWYISLIVVLYFLYPFIYRLQKKNSLFIALIMGCLFAVNIVMLTTVPDFYASRERAFTRMLIFFLGSLTGEVLKKKSWDSKKHGIFMAYSGAMLVMYIIGILSAEYGFDWFSKPVAKLLIRFGGQGAAILVIVLLCLLFEKVKMAGVKKELSFLGGITLEIYLIHVFITNIITKTGFIENKGYPIIFAVMTAVMIMSVIIAWIFSKIYNSIVDRLENKKSAA